MWPPRVRTCGVPTGPARWLRGGIRLPPRRPELVPAGVGPWGQPAVPSRLAGSPPCASPRAHHPSLLDTAPRRTPAWLLFSACRWPRAQLLEAWFLPSVSESPQATGEE